ncbi:hypothetical protein O1L55_30300 [Streptomyces albulus]|nr:hypothetical protein [Streptomyces noursei]
MLRGIPRSGGSFQLIDGAADAFAQRGVDGELAVGQAVEQGAVEGHRCFGLGQRAVSVGQKGLSLVEEAAVAVVPQGVDVVARGCLHAGVE